MYTFILDWLCIKQKNGMWELIAEQYNAKQKTGPRTISQLKTAYDMIKRQTKKSLSDNKVSYNFY